MYTIIADEVKSHSYDDEVLVFFVTYWSEIIARCGRKTDHQTVVAYYLAIQISCYVTDYEPSHIYGWCNYNITVY